MAEGETTSDRTTKELVLEYLEQNGIGAQPGGAAGVNAELQRIKNEPTEKQPPSPPIPAASPSPEAPPADKS